MISVVREAKSNRPIANMITTMSTSNSTSNNLAEDRSAC
jgi:hypothetical protein